MPDQVQSNFNLSYSQLLLTCNSVHQFMLRDSAEFALYAVQAADISAFNDLINAYEQLPIDSEFEGAVKREMQHRTENADKIRGMLKSADVRAKMLYASSPADYGMYHIKDMSRLNDGDLLIFSRSVKRLIAANAAEFLTVGWTAAMTTELDGYNEALEAAMTNYKKAVADRDEGTRVRITKGNELYAKCASYCEIGKTIWDGVNEAFYNDYLVYAGTGETIKPPSVLSYDFFAKEFNWSAVSNADDYELQAKYPGATEFLTIYQGPNISFSMEVQVGITQCRIRSQSEMYGDSIWSSQYEVNNYTPNAPVNININYNAGTHSADITWNAQPGTVKYKLYRSRVPLGAPAGAWEEVVTVSGTSANTGELLSGWRYYFRLTTFTGLQESVPSADVHVDVEYA